MLAGQRRVWPGVLTAGWLASRVGPVSAGGLRRGPGAVVLGPVQQVTGLVLRLGRQVLRLVLGRPRRAQAGLPRRGGRPGGGGPVAGVLRAFLDDVADLGPGRDQLEDAAVDLPVAELLSLVAVVAQVADVQPVAQVVQHHAALAAEHADRAGFPHGLDLGNRQLLAPVPGGRLEAQVLRRRARRK
jgi:hypothetical protein